MDYGAALARLVPNPNRRSRTYTRQSRFEGSDRQLRGEILRRLLDGGPAAPAAFAARIAKSFGTDAARVRPLLADLEREGFIQRHGRRVLIAGHGGPAGRAP